MLRGLVERLTAGDRGPGEARRPAPGVRGARRRSVHRVLRRTPGHVHGLRSRGRTGASSSSIEPAAALTWCRPASRIGSLPSARAPRCARAAWEVQAWGRCCRSRTSPCASAASSPSTVSSFTVERGPDVRPHRPQRGGQDHPLQRDQPALRGRPRAASPSTARTCWPCRRTASPASASPARSRTWPSSRPLGAGQRPHGGVLRHRRSGFVTDHGALARRPSRRSARAATTADELLDSPGARPRGRPPGRRPAVRHAQADRAGPGPGLQPAAADARRARHRPHPRRGRRAGRPGAQGPGRART